jgi:hypothetical protein
MPRSSGIACPDKPSRSRLSTGVPENTVASARSRRWRLKASSCSSFQPKSAGALSASTRCRLATSARRQRSRAGWPSTRLPGPISTWMSAGRMLHSSKGSRSGEDPAVPDRRPAVCHGRVRPAPRGQGPGRGRDCRGRLSAPPPPGTAPRRAGPRGVSAPAAGRSGPGPRFPTRTASNAAWSLHGTDPGCTSRGQGFSVCGGIVAVCRPKMTQRASGRNGRKGCRIRGPRAPPGGSPRPSRR